MLDKDEFRKEYNGETAASVNEPYFDPDWVAYVFRGLLRCGACGERVVFCGSGTLEQEHDESPRGWDWYDNFTPRYFFPTVRLIKIEHEEAVPLNVITAIDKACELFWCDIDSCANRVRTAVEYVLDDLLGIPKGKGITLHRRIQQLDTVTHGDVKTLLEAVKWIGNAGSHEAGALNRVVVIEQFRILEHCLSLLYPKPPVDATHILEMAKAINAAKGPVIINRSK